MTLDTSLLVDRLLGATILLLVAAAIGLLLFIPARRLPMKLAPAAKQHVVPTKAVVIRIIAPVVIVYLIAIHFVIGLIGLGAAFLFVTIQEIRWYGSLSDEQRRNHSEVFGRFHRKPIAQAVRWL